MVNYMNLPSCKMYPNDSSFPLIITLFVWFENFAINIVVYAGEK